MQFLACGAAAPGAMEKVSAWLDPLRCGRTAPAVRIHEDSDAGSGCQPHQDQALDSRMYSQGRYESHLPVAAAAGAGRGLSGAGGPQVALGHLQHCRHTPVQAPGAAPGIHRVATPDGASTGGLHRHGDDGELQRENWLTGGPGAAAQQVSIRPAGEVQALGPADRAAGKDISNQGRPAGLPGRGVRSFLPCTLSSCFPGGQSVAFVALSLAM